MVMSRFSRDLLAETYHAPHEILQIIPHGAPDRLTPFEFAALPLLEQLRDARLYALARCGHVPALEHQQEFLRVLTDFLESDA